MFITKEINYKDFLPSRESFTKENTLMVCEDFGFNYLFFGEITPENTGNIELIFDIVYKDVYKEPVALIPTEDYKDLFIEFKEKCFEDSESFYILDREDFLFLEPINRDAFKLMIPAGTLVFKSMKSKQARLAIIDVLKAFWGWSIIRKGNIVGYSKNKKEEVEK